MIYNEAFVTNQPPLHSDGIHNGREQCWGCVGNRGYDSRIRLTDTSCALEGFRGDEPLGFVPSYALMLGAPALLGATASYVGARRNKGRAALFGAIGGLVGGGVLALLGRKYRFDL